LDRSIRLSAGVTVRATSSDTTTASAYEKAKGRKNEPVRPLKKKTGTIARTTIRVA
jgi:hypothetical protein